MKKESNLNLVICKYPEQYKIFDKRVNKPVCFKSFENDKEVGSMVLQELDRVVFNKKKNIFIEYFPPNTIGLLISISLKSLDEASQIYKKYLDPYRKKVSSDDIDDNKKEFLMDISKIICDYIEKIQISIVFSYTALETFCNLSIPEDYVHKFKDNKGIRNSYDKPAIERWIPLRDKLSIILPKIYKTKDIKTKKFWNHFIRLEEYRNDIIHQKSIDRTEYYKQYFRQNIFKICSNSVEVLNFYYKEYAKHDRINPLWPWLINSKKEFPIRTDYDPQNFEVVGNLYEGFHKK